MTTRTAACGVAATLGLSGTLIGLGVQIGSDGPSFGRILPAILGMLMLGIALFSAWLAGSMQGGDDRDYGDDPQVPVPPLDGETLRPAAPRTPEPATPPTYI